ncbi:MAG TPA: ABC transporter [Acidimicrobiaceae bacterium]|jgi:ABC-type branched-subunit amino acid transport system ATPase component|nr:ABC transporter [Acidimicrobiaceae bacterium]
MMAEPGGETMTDGYTEDAAALAAAVLDEEAKRQAEQAKREAGVVLPDDLLPGVGEEPMSLREAFVVGGKGMAILLLLLNLVDELPRTIRVLAPDIQRSLGISDTVLFGVFGFGGVALVLGTVPMAALADRIRRVALIPIMSGFWAVATFLSGFVVNPFQLFWATAATGLGQAYRIPVSNSLITDTYPIQARSRIFAFEGVGRPIGQLLGPLLVGGIAVSIGGDDAWRYAFFILAIPPVLLGLVSLRLREPERGRFEQDAVLSGEDALDVDELEPSMSTAFARLRKIRTFYALATGIGVVGFALIVVPGQFNLLLDRKYGLDALERGIVESLIWLGSLVSIPIAGRVFGRKFREDPDSVVRIMGTLIMAAGLLYLVVLPVKTLGLLIFGLALAQALISAALVAAPMIIAAVSPYRIRTQAFALLPVFIFLMGGFFGGLLGGQISDVYSNRTAMLILGPPGALLGGWLIRRGAHHIRRDISLSVEELLEEQEEARKIATGDDEVPALQVRNLDFSYGPVQVLFDVSFDVAPGEVVALLGTNGAGKSTLLRAISGLGIPDRGVVRLNGRTITYAEAETRFRVGIVQLRGGAGIFPGLSIGDNLRASLLGIELEPDEIERRVDAAVDRFPALQGRLNENAESLSGGQQQMLALAMTLIQEPEVLLIDELSLGLAPVIVQELLGVIEQLKMEGQAMVIVEQSLNVALAFADRAVFMEKGQVRFSGPAQELAERGDLARAVFLGGEGG